MDAIDTIINDAGKFLSGNTTYSHYKQQWQFLFESYIGGEEYKQAGHLTRYVNESAGEYAARLESTPLQNHCHSVISVYNGFLFRQQPTRTYGTIENLPELEDFLYDADMDGRSFNAFMKDVATYASIFGHSWVIVAKPNIGANTRGEEMEAGVRPYVSMLSPLVVLDWSWKRNANGRYTLDYFKYIEDVNGQITTAKEWTPEFIRTVVIDEDEGVVREQYVEPNGLGKIPAVIAYNQRSIIRGIGISDIADIASAQKYVYNALSEIEQSIRLDSHPSLVKTPETNAGVGAGAIIHMPDNMDPGLKPYVLDFEGASVSTILQAIEQTNDAIDKMANTGAVRATVSRTMSGVAMETEFQLLNSRLSEKGDALELAEEQIWKLWAEYMNTTWEGTIEYPDSFNLRDNRNDLELYMRAAEAPVQSETFRKELHKQIAKTIIKDDEMMDAIVGEVDSAEQFQPHIMYSPAGTPELALTQQDHERLSAQGYTHEQTPQQ
jgi:hypothetical protein